MANEKPQKWHIRNEDWRCLVCDLPVPRGQLYCGASCEQMDELDDDSAADVQDLNN